MTSNVWKQRWLFVIVWFALVAPAVSAQNRFVTVRGKEFVSSDGRPMLLQGINLGNWLLPEGYMFKLKQSGFTSRCS